MKGINDSPENDDHRREKIVGRIFCLMGKSSSGKDTIFQRLKMDKELGLIPVLPYTTRPKRHNEKDGVDYFFIDEDTLQRFCKDGKVIEKRQYSTIDGMWYYCTIDDGQFNLADFSYLIITTLEAYGHLQGYFGRENVVPLYIAADDGTRLERALNRERKQERPNYDELCRRFLADNIDFNHCNLERNKISKHYNNYDLEECINDLREDILKLV